LLHAAAADMKGEVLTPVSILKKGRDREGKKERKAVLILEEEIIKNTEKKVDAEYEDEPTSETFESSSSLTLGPAPPAGSLADREHRKWEEKAIALSNNPYSKENIARRRTWSLATLPTLRSVQDAELVLSGQRSQDIQDLTSIYTSLYKRDYYVQMEEERTSERIKITDMRKEDNVEAAKISGVEASEKYFAEKKSETKIMEDEVDENNLTDGDMPARSVLEEVARFQQEINKVMVENVKYPAWRQQRLGRRHSSPAGGKLHSIAEDVAKQKENNNKEEDTAEKEEKRVRYAENEVTVYKYEEENSVTSHRQLQPSLYLHPSDPPEDTEDNSETGVDDTEDRDIAEEMEKVPTLPSVKELASRFTVMRTLGSHMVTKTAQ